MKKSIAVLVSFFMAVCFCAGCAYAGERDFPGHGQLQHAAAAGDAGAQLELGKRYESGRGAAQNHSLARMWYAKAAAQGSPEAMFNLGVMYLRGEGGPRNDAKAEKCFARAAKAGFAPAMTCMAILRMEGGQVGPDAVRLLKKAADKGDAGAQFLLGGLYASGRGVPQDAALALFLFRNACSGGLPEACARADEISR